MENENYIWQEDDAYSKYYNPTEHLALNEMIVLFKCTLVFKKQSCIPKKHKLLD